jgi:hypothetical protein
MGTTYNPQRSQHFAQPVLPDAEDNTSVDIVMAGYVIMIWIKHSKNCSERKAG